jgi:hypothetical protein
VAVGGCVVGPGGTESAFPAPCYWFRNELFFEMNELFLEMRPALLSDIGIDAAVFSPLGILARDLMFGFRPFMMF